MKVRVFLAIFALSAAVQAADTPSPAPAAAAKVDRVEKARQAIAGKDWNVAVRELQAAVKETPQDADAHNLLGYSYRKRANPDLAKSFEHYEMALKINPNHKGAHEYIGEAYLMQGKPAEAETHLVKLEQICGGRGCEEYQDLAKSISEWKAKR
ncbi:tetratricopeptide repeat protein [Ramlibacter sp. PS3R-8]|uniref:tetratricopeptide repeat protein n=1 Tax=Ramlibacter sp. PS3R-8 TaxID=3133437 RepID=UPI0030A85C5E